MQFLKTLFWALLVGVVVAFSIGNMTSVPIRLWGGLVADVNLPLLVGTVFLLGFLPPFLTLQAVRWRLRQRLAACERTITELRATPTAAPLAGDPLVPATVVDPDPVLPGGADAAR